MTNVNLARGLTTYRVYRWLWSSLDWLFPLRCARCDTSGYRWCPDCVRKTTRLPGSERDDDGTICQSCGAPVSMPGLCVRCRKNPPAYQAFRSWGKVNGPLHNTIHLLKYQRDNALGDELGHYLVDDVMTTGATLHSYANTLQAAGAARFFALTLARAIAGYKRR